VLVVGTVAVLALTTAAQLVERERGGVRDLAAGRATARVVGVVRSAPRPVPGAPGESAGSVRVLLALRSVTPVASSSASARADPATGTRDAGGAIDVIGPADTWAGLAYGDRVEAEVRLSEQPDRSRRTVARARASDPPRVVPVRQPVLSGAERLRAGLVTVSASLPGDARALLPAVAVGDVRWTADLEPAMRGSGLAHLTAVSGAHFSILGALVLGLCGWCRVPRRHRWLPTALVLVGFVALVQPGASVVRAAVMGAVGLVGLVAGRPARSVPALAGAVVVLLVVDPWLARDLGFVLSVVATAGIATLAGPLAARWERRTGRTLALVLAVPCAAQAVCGPVVLLLQPAVPTYAVLANVVVGPAVGPATVLGLLAALLSVLWPVAAGWVAALAGAACWWIAVVARVAVALPGAQVAWAGGALGVLLLAGAAAAVLVLLLSAGRGTLGACPRLLPLRPADLRDRVLAALPRRRASRGTRSRSPPSS
jgi:competence protein ComEC